MTSLINTARDACLRDRVWELSQRLRAIMDEQGVSPDELKGRLDQYFWLRSDLEAFLNADFSPAVLTLSGVDRVCEVLGVPMGEVLGGIDGDERPLPERIDGPKEAWHIGQHVGQVLHRRRKLLGLDLKAIAKSIGMPTTMLENIEDGWIEPSILDLFMLNDRLGMTLADLIGDLAEDAQSSNPAPDEGWAYPLGENRDGDLAVRLWWRRELASDPQAWMMVILRYEGDIFDVVAQDELTDEDWSTITRLATELVARARGATPELKDLPRVGFKRS